VGAVILYLLLPTDVDELPLDQGSMVLDDHRNGCYRRALEQVIGPESVVMDLVAGLGILLPRLVPKRC